MSKSIKERVLEKLIDILDKRIEVSKNALKTTREARDSETKSSAGDKYETGREMVQIEMGKLQDQLDKSIKLKSAISKIDPCKITSKVELGSLVITTHGKYMVSVGLGVLEVKGEKYFAISLASPIGQLLEGNGSGDKITFQGRETEILEIK